MIKQATLMFSQRYLIEMRLVNNCRFDWVVDKLLGGEGGRV